MVFCEWIFPLGECHNLWPVLIIIERKWMSLPCLREQNAAEIGVIMILDTDEVICLTFMPVRRAKDRCGRFTHRIILGHRDDNAHLSLSVVETREVID
jgi:hypothetical protein